MKKLKRLNKIKLGFLVLVCCVFSCENKPQAKQWAQLGSDSLLFEVGTLRRDSIYTFHFYVKSIGDEPLKIDTVSHDCECTQVQFPKHAINKGDSAKFTVTYKPDRLDSGRFMARSMIRANIKNYFIPLRFRGTLIDN